MPLPTPVQGAPYTWSVNADANGNPIATTDSSGDGIAATAVPTEGMSLFNGSTMDRLRGNNGIADNQLFGVAVVEPCLYNGSGVDRQRNNLDNITLINASNVSTTQTSADQTNFNGRGVKVTINVTTIGAGSLVTTIRVKDPVSGIYTTLLTSAAVTTNTSATYTVYPGITATANISVSDIITRTWDISVAGASGTTFTVGAMVIV